jgi:hypothetical protein
MKKKDLKSTLEYMNNYWKASEMLYAISLMNIPKKTARKCLELSKELAGANY